MVDIPISLNNDWSSNVFLTILDHYSVYILFCSTNLVCTHIVLFYVSCCYVFVHWDWLLQYLKIDNLVSPDESLKKCQKECQTF